MDYEDELTPPVFDSETDFKNLFDSETRSAGRTCQKAPPPWGVGHVMGNFRLEELLGQGNSGYVFRVLDLETERTFALKILVNEQDTARNRLGFRRMTGIEHPNLVRVHRIHELENHVALSMDEVSGLTLGRKIKVYKKTLEPHEAYSKLIALIRHYASGLAMMHGCGLVHRDIKPRNLMVNNQHVGLVIDYGLVSTFDPDTDPNGFRNYLAGSPRYFAPEVIFDQFYTPAGDIYSLGLVALEAINQIAGHESWQRNDDDREADAVLIGNAVGGLGSSVPNVLRDACEEMLERRPANRPTASEIGRLGLPAARKYFMVSGLIFGRDEELDDADQWLQSVYDGNVGQLHIHGPAGAGKTCLVDELVRRMKSSGWWQVFRISCEPRGHQTYHPISQLADQIAARYKSLDRHPLVLDVVTANIVQQICPVLKDVIKIDLSLPAAKSESAKELVHEAANRMTKELSKVGPLVYIIEDLQWASREVTLLIDQVRSYSSGMVGIITVSRDKAVPQEHLPTDFLEVTPIGHEAGVQWLTLAASRAGATVSPAVIDALAKAANGYPLRLMELAQEFNPGGVLADLDKHADFDSAGFDLQQLWKRRASRLSDDARSILLILASAGRSVSVKQLATLTGLGNIAVDDAVAQLVQHKLAMDDATGGECIAMVHDEITLGVLADFEPLDIRATHIAWAEMLAESEDAVDQSARIATHFMNAGDTDRAMPYALAAAEADEQKLHFSKAAKWYCRLMEFASESNRAGFLRSAADCFRRAHLFSEAAVRYLELESFCDSEDQRRDLKVVATEMLIRAGEFDKCDHALHDLAKMLGLPERRQIRVDASHPIAKPNVDFLCDHQSGRFLSAIEMYAVDACTSLPRPLVLFDEHYARDLVSYARQFADRMNEDQRFSHALDTLIASLVSGPEPTEKLARLSDQVKGYMRDQDGSDQAKAEFWGFHSLFNAVQGNWSEVTTDAERSRNLYQSAGQGWRFERSVVDAFAVASHAHLGQWKLMHSVAEEAHHDALRSNDQLAIFLSTSGYGVLHYLFEDQPGHWSKFVSANEALVDAAVSPHASMLHGLSLVCEELYSRRFDSAWMHYSEMHELLRQPGHVSLPVVAAMVYRVGALVALHQRQQAADAGGTHHWTEIALQCCADLRSVGLPHAMACADLLEGLAIHTMDSVKATDLFIHARQSAEQNGWRPIKLAAVDALASLDGVSSSRKLREALRHEGVANPLRFERLYTVTNE